jgi:signal recognition particle subunit SRP68
VNWSTELLSHAQALHASGRLSATSLAEATVYTVITNGRFLRHRADYEDALHQLCVARGLLGELSRAASSTRDQALYALFGDEVGPEIRHCAHELGSNRAHDVDGLVKHFGEKHRAELVSGYDALVQGIQAEAARGGADEARRQLDVLMWEDEPVPVRNPELVDVLLRVQRAQAKLRADQGEKGKKPEGASAATSKRGVAAYDAILLALSDAEEVARKLAEAQKVKNLLAQMTSVLKALQTSGTAAASGTRDLQFVHSYIVYQLLSRRVERDLLLATALVSSSQPSKSKTGKANAVDARLYPAVIKLLDTVLQSLEQMRTLPLVDESSDLGAAVDIRISYTKARR